MLTYADKPTIENAIKKRLGKERGVWIREILATKMPAFFNAAEGKWIPPHIAVGTLLTLGEDVIMRSRFNLPLEFELSHLHNEIDQIAEQCKEARLQKGISDLTGVAMEPEIQLKGTGLMGLWPK